jgi:hypothetical protein
MFPGHGRPTRRETMCVRLCAVELFENTATFLNHEKGRGRGVKAINLRVLLRFVNEKYCLLRIISSFALQNRIL